MRFYVDGAEVELDTHAVEVVQLSDRLMVRTAEGSFSALAVRHGDSTYVSFKGRQYRIDERNPTKRIGLQASSGEIRAPMPGQIVAIRRQTGDNVAKGDTILVLEAMKTQQPFAAPFDGIVSKILVSQGEQVGDGSLLAVVEPVEASVER